MVGVFKICLEAVLQVDVSDSKTEDHILAFCFKTDFSVTGIAAKSFPLTLMKTI